MSALSPPPVILRRVAPKDPTREMNQPPEYSVYIVTGRSHSRVLYTGVTSNLARRMEEHRAGTFPGFSAKYRCHVLVYFESFDDVRQAIAREKRIKGWKRVKKLALIEARNPSWVELGVKE